MPQIKKTGKPIYCKLEKETNEKLEYLMNFFYGDKTEIVTYAIDALYEKALQMRAENQRGFN